MGGSISAPSQVSASTKVLLLLENRRGARNRESAVGREVDHTGIVDEETTLTRTTNAHR